MYIKDMEKKNASSYCDYNDTFISYDQNRQPNGLTELLNIFEETYIHIISLAFES